MTRKELTKQAFKLYDNIRVQSYETPARSKYRERLHSVGLRAFYRYKRRLKAEQNQERMLEASRWGL
ncbi:MAG TPA: hypothetical protein VIF37_09665 [Methylobacter sp.]|jgi:hypothetical protein